MPIQCNTALCLHVCGKMTQREEQNNKTYLHKILLCQRVLKTVTKYMQRFFFDHKPACVSCCKFAKVTSSTMTAGVKVRHFNVLTMKFRIDLWKIVPS